jgi:hypothetical protein
MLRRLRRRWAAVCLAAGAVNTLVSGSASAQDNWIGGTSDWNNSVNWDSGIPTSGDNVDIVNTDTSTPTVMYDSTDPTVTLSSLSVNNSGGGMDTLALQSNGVLLSANSETIGNSGAAAVVQTAGVNYAGALNVDYDGSYNLSGSGTLSVAGSEFVDFAATFTQSGGDNTMGGSLLLSSQAGSSGTYALSGGTLAVGFGEFIADVGTASFTQTGGSNSASVVEIGFGAGASASYTLACGATLSVISAEGIGYSGSGSFVQTGGMNTAAMIYVATNAGAMGYYCQSGGVLLSGRQYVGDGGSGAFVQSGGTNTLQGGASLYLGYLAGATGSYTLSNTAALIVTGSEFVGYGSNGGAYGNFTQTCGSNSISGNLALATNAASSGSYTLQAGTLALTGGSSVEDIGESGTGTFTQSGGLNNFGGAGEYVGVLNKSSGTYNQTGGVNGLLGSASNLCLGYDAGASGTYNLSGGMLTAANIYVGGTPTLPGGTGVLNITGNGQLSTPGALVIYGTTGSAVQISGGSITAGQVTVNGAFDQSAGSAQIGRFAGTGTVTITGGQTDLSAGSGASQVGGLNISGTGRLDIANNNLVINYGSGTDPISAIVSYLSSGYDGGAWTGYGLFSSTAEANAPLVSVGYLDSTDPGGMPNQILVKCAMPGDVNLDGTVNFTDLLVVAQHFNTTGNDWAHGNFVYRADGLVNFSDLLAVAQNFNHTLPVGLAAQIQPETVELPEPGSAALVAIPLAGMLARRRRKMQLNRRGAENAEKSI